MTKTTYFRYKIKRVKQSSEQMLFRMKTNKVFLPVVLDFFEFTGEFSNFFVFYTIYSTTVSERQMFVIIPMACLVAINASDLIRFIEQLFDVEQRRLSQLSYNCQCM